MAISTYQSVPDILYQRRTVFKFRPDPIAVSRIERYIEAATWAPNHHLTEPWRFFVLTGDAKAELADIRAECQRDKYRDKPHVERIAEKARQEYLTVPAIVVVVQKAPERPDQRDEDYAACAAATYGMLLAAWADGVGSYWGTGRVARSPRTAQLLGLSADDRIVAIVRLGQVEELPPMKRKPVSEVTTWLP